jgi:SNF2 family DNA or RNA helicase
MIYMMLKKLNQNLAPTFQAFNYQADAFHAIKEKEYFGIFHEQGLGKTKIGIDLALHWIKSDVCNGVIFVTKKGLIQNWEDEIKIHTSIHPVIFSPNKKENSSKFFSYAKIFICHFDLIANDLENFITFAKLRKLGMVLDESVAIKNPTTNKAKSFHALAPLLKRRIIMTGTPVDNRPYDIWSQIYFLDMGLSLGRNFKSFKERYDFSKDMSSSKVLQELFEIDLRQLKDSIREFTLRETKESCKIDLPQKQFQKIEVDFEEEQRNLYEKILTEVSIELKKDGKWTVDNIEFIAVQLLRLIQVSSNPSTYDEGYDKETPKATAIKKLISGIPENEKIIIWTHFVKTAAALEKILRGYSIGTIHGGKDLDLRNKTLSDFKKESGPRILIATYGTAKEGLTLTQANHAIYYERNFSLSDYLQSQDRIHRISQTKVSYIYNIITKNSIEEWVESLVNAKQMAAQYVQGDILLDEYQEKINYSFNNILQDILKGNK